MELRVLGCHGGETPKHRTSSFLLDGRVAIDAGAVTSMMTLEEQHKIEAVFVSHAHLDHVRDLATLADNRCQQGGPTLEIAAIPETIAVLKKHFFNDLLWPDFSKIPTKLGPTISFRELTPEKTETIAGMLVTPVLVSHTIDACGFIIENGHGGALGYSGDTGPTDRFWEVLGKHPNLRGLLMEISFPNDQQWLAKASGHHTAETLSKDLDKLHGHKGLPTLLYHIKPVFEAAVEREVAKIHGKSLEICRLGDCFIL